MTEGTKVKAQMRKKLKPTLRNYFWSGLYIYIGVVNSYYVLESNINRIDGIISVLLIAVAIVFLVKRELEQWSRWEDVDSKNVKAA